MDIDNQFSYKEISSNIFLFVVNKVVKQCSSVLNAWWLFQHGLQEDNFVKLRGCKIIDQSNFNYFP